MTTGAPTSEVNAPGVRNSAPRVHLSSLDTLWFQVGGTLCNLTCTHCFISCSPTNHTHELMTLAQIRPYLDEAVRLGVREYYFTGGEPFINKEMEEIIRETLRVGPVTVLTNGLLLDPARCDRLAALSAHSEYSFDLRISLDGYNAETNDAIRGEGTFDRILSGVEHAGAVGINPVLTVTEVHEENGTDDGRRRFLRLLAEIGIDRPRLKILPVFKLGAEAERTGGYQGWEALESGAADTWSHLQCSSCRMVTDLGVWVCPILVNEPSGRMGDRLADTLDGFPLDHPACWTCHVHEVSCRT
ncbi:MAG: hypothetical protein BMS9Abin29_1216 [Gemmatimonadota bacterium]|nr:MAG: hypothetical protein BMS9Abin29_1216 [Gemmatimonadota bacterium]